ncbi:uncharacterized protein LOC124616467 [Schistocerca americana]|uniref:uncharacterized protein LOC124616467 n=1 Tax=Schistocerca americana TaxID=7009 RepID=UPI001F4F6C5E|nr:uncharacterized protein LOC124616467 [Schistocerca americana]
MVKIGKSMKMESETHNDVESYPEASKFIETAIENTDTSAHKTKLQAESIEIIPPDGFGRGDTSYGRKKKGSVNKGVKKTKTSVPSLNQIPSVTVVASQPVQVNFPQSYTPEKSMRHAVYNQLPQPQAVMQSPESPPHCIVAVAYDSRRILLAHNPIYRQ